MIPEKFKERMKNILAGDYDAFISEIENGTAVRALRINKIKLPDEIPGSLFDDLGIDAEHSRVPFCGCGYYTSVEKPGSMPQHHAGMVYMQDPSAMITVSSVTVTDNMNILDTCAAPGGKTTQLAALVPNGTVVANEYVTSRCRILRGNVERLGCRNVTVTNLDTSALPAAYAGLFDLVVADAPCSGEGMFRKNELAVSEWSDANIALCAERQAKILDNAEICVKNGGFLLYSTCTFSIEENEKNVSDFLDRHSDFRLCEVNSELMPYTSPGINYDGCKHDMTLTRRFYPHVSKGEGQYIALMKRCSDTESGCRPRDILDKNSVRRKKRSDVPPPNVRILSSAEYKTVISFFEENLCGITDPDFIVCGDTVFLRSDDLPVPAYGTVSCGVAVGTFSSGRLVPHHHLFSACGNCFKNRVTLSSHDPRTERYLLGEEIEYTGVNDGWCAVIVDGCPLGGGKVSHGTVKNHYPKGLRNKK